MKLLSWLNESDSTNFLEPDQTPMGPLLRHRLEELAQIPVTQIMTPRPLIQGLDADVQLRRVKRLKSSKAKFFAVYRGDLDRILGWIEKSKVLELLADGRDEARLERFVQPVARLNESAPAHRLAEVLLGAKSPIVVVVNDHGQTVGTVNILQFVKLLFGFDLEESAPTPQATESQPKSYEV